LHAIQLEVDDKASGVCRQVLRRVHKARASGRLRVRSSAAVAALAFAKAPVIGADKGRSSTHGYDLSLEAAMAAFAKSWRREKV
jgi:hypothetical protein